MTSRDTLRQRLEQCADKLDGYNFAAQVVPLLREAAVALTDLEAQVSALTAPPTNQQKMHILVAEIRRCVQDALFPAAYRKLAALDELIAAPPRGEDGLPPADHVSPAERET